MWFIWTYALPWIGQEMADNYRDRFLPSPAASP
jgi:hypothetical protein